jgi:hypothetical protein
LDEIVDAIETSGREFGEEHGKDIEKTALRTVVATATVASIALGAKKVGADKYLHNSARNTTLPPPPKV